MVRFPHKILPGIWIGLREPLNLDVVIVSGSKVIKSVDFIYCIPVKKAL